MREQQTAMWLKVVITLMFVTGALIFLYPFVSNVINQQVDQYRITKYQEMTDKEKKEQLVRKAALEKEAEKRHQLGLDLTDDLFDEVPSSHTVSQKEMKEHLIGAISIPKIDVSLPIFDVTTSDYLQVGATLLPGASYPTGGKSTHSVITGHTGLAEKKLFTDVRDLKKGDHFYVTVLDEPLAYEVDQIKTVLPDHLDDLNVVQDKDYMTLVTCTPYMVNTHRLLVRGHRIPLDKEKISVETKKVKEHQRRLLGGYLLLILGLVSLLLAVIYRQVTLYLGLKRKHHVAFRVLRKGRPVQGIVFQLVNPKTKKAVKRNRKPIVAQSNRKGIVTFNNVTGYHYEIMPVKDSSLARLRLTTGLPLVRKFNLKIRVSGKSDKWSIEKIKGGNHRVKKNKS